MESDVHTQQTDRFCRLCGERRSVPQARTVEGALESSETSRVADQDARASDQAMTELERSGAIEPRLSYRLVSGPVVWALSTPAGSMRKGYGPRIKGMVSLLISVPVWVIILLLSPLDAYAAAKVITEARLQQHP